MRGLYQERSSSSSSFLARTGEIEDDFYDFFVSGSPFCRFNAAYRLYHSTVSKKSQWYGAALKKR